MGLLVFLISYAATCGVLYIACRWGEKRAPTVMAVFGGLVLVVWVLLFAAFALLAGLNLDLDGDAGASPPYPWPLTLTVLGILLFTFIGGSWLHRRFSTVPIGFWRGCFFYTLYYAVIWLANAFLQWQFGLFDSVSLPSGTQISLPIGEYIGYAWALFVWYFPFGAPLSWLVIARLRQGLANGDV